jgi:hypothetical protein
MLKELAGATARQPAARDVASLAARVLQHHTSTCQVGIAALCAVVKKESDKAGLVAVASTKCSSSLAVQVSTGNGNMATCGV